MKQKIISNLFIGLMGSLGCDTLMIPHCLDSRLTDESEIKSFTHRPRSIPKKYVHFSLWYLFLLEAE
jgi:hypothetical protein